MPREAIEAQISISCSDPCATFTVVSFTPGFVGAYGDSPTIELALEHQICIQESEDSINYVSLFARSALACVLHYWDEQMRWNMKALENLEDPGRILTHASLYLWKHWRQYPLAAWENAETILRRAHDAVEEEDRIEFVRILDCLGELQNPRHVAPVNAAVVMQGA
jgi:hypothetical protein